MGDPKLSSWRESAGEKGYPYLRKRPVGWNHSNITQKENNIGSWEAELTTWDTAESWFGIKLRGTCVMWCLALRYLLFHNPQELVQYIKSKTRNPTIRAVINQLR